MSTWLISTNGILLTAGNGLPSVGATPPPAATASFDVTVAKRSNLQVAPEAIYFEISNWSGFNTTGPGVGETRDERLHRIEYIWDFYYTGTDNSYTYTAPVNLYSGSARHTNGHKNSRYAYGFQASHTYREPGTYTVRVLGYEIGSGIIGEGTVEVTIGDPDTQFSGVNGTTIFVSATSTTTNQPAGSTLVTETNLTTLLNTYALNESNPVRIMYDWGETGTGTNFANMDYQNFPSVHICSPGVSGGTRPSIATAGFNIFNNTNRANDLVKDFHISGMEFTGSFDDSSDGNPTGGAGWFGVETGMGSILMDGCVVSNKYTAFTVSPALSGSNYASLFTFNDTVIENVDVAISGCHVGTTLVKTGCRLMHNPSASMGNQADGGYLSRHDCSDYVVHSCDFYSRKTNTFTTNNNEQPCMRISANGNATDVRAVISASNMEGGGGMLVTSLADSGSTQGPGNILIEKTYFMGTYATAAAHELIQPGVTFRNNIVNFPAVADRRSLPGPDGGVTLDSTPPTGSTDSSGYDEPNEIYNNTVINNLGGSQSVVVANTDANFQETIQNNIIHQPNLTSPVTTYAPLSDAANLFTPRSLGYFTDSVDDTADTATPTTAGTTDVFAPETGSSAIGGATTGLVSMTDFYGRLRSDVMSGLTRTDESLGAIEVALES